MPTKPWRQGVPVIDRQGPSAPVIGAQRRVLLEEDLSRHGCGAAVPASMVDRAGPRALLVPAMVGAGIVARRGAQLVYERGHGRSPE
jgi:hypothetical protein